MRQFALITLAALTLMACGRTPSSLRFPNVVSDADNDGLGNPSVTLSDCDQPNGYVANADDTMMSAPISWIVWSLGGSGAPTWLPIRMAIA